MAQNAQTETPAGYSPKDFLKKHVKGIPHEKIKERKVHFGFKYKDLKGFIEGLIAQYKGVESPDLIAKISELEMKLGALQAERDQVHEKAVGLETQVTQIKAESIQAAAAVGEGAAAEAQAAGAKAAELAGSLEQAATDKTALEAKIAELQAALSGAGEAAQKVADLSAELAALKENFAKLEQENEFIDGEMTKLDQKNKELEAALESTKNEIAQEKAAREDEVKSFDSERGTLNTRIGEMSGIIANSKDTQKLLEMQKQFDTYRTVFEIYETAAAEAFDIEARPDPAAIAKAAEAVRAKAAGGPADAALKHLETRLASLQAGIKDMIGQMYENKGSFRLIMDLVKAVAREQETAAGMNMLQRIVG